MLPAALRAAIAAVAEGQKMSRVARHQGAMSEHYRAGAASAGVIDSGEAAIAYLLARFPATYAAVEQALGQLQRAAPDFAPETILDAGCGPGTAGFAALDAFPAARRLLGIDHNARFLRLAGRIAGVAGLTGSREIAFQSGDLGADLRAEKADLVLLSYALVELAETAAPTLALRLWAQAGRALILVEPGSRAGFLRLRAARTALLGAGAVVVAPCSHGEGCPMPEGDWCHFSVRLARSREHQRAKAAQLPYEDEKFAYLVALRQGAPAFSARIVKPVQHSKAGHRGQLCDAGGLRDFVVSPRDPAFREAKKWRWGDGL